MHGALKEAKSGEVDKVTCLRGGDGDGRVPGQDARVADSGQDRRGKGPAAECGGHHARSGRGYSH